PQCYGDELHLLESEVGVIQRQRQRPDGVSVAAFLWTSIDRDSPSVLLNVENDDYGCIERAGRPCSCELGVIGMRTRLSGIRGISKVTTAGITLPAETLGHLAEVLLPVRFGGVPGNYQFVQDESAGDARLQLRVDPLVGAIDEREMLKVVASELSRTDSGILANAIWSAAGSLRVVRAEPLLTRSGKLFPLATSTSGPGRP
ncbi:MAG: hypothetical protein ACRD6W_03715, partial [Nitrososphaerales archaeon]